MVQYGCSAKLELFTHCLNAKRGFYESNTWARYNASLLYMRVVYTAIVCVKQNIEKIIC